MIARCVIALMLCWPAIAAGQVTGRLYLEKETFASGEPVFLYFEVRNTGGVAQKIATSDPYSWCANWTVQLTPDATRGLHCTPMMNGFAGSCASSDRIIEPGKTYTERILVNYEHPIRSAGDYEIEAEKQITYGAGSETLSPATAKVEKVHATIRFRVDHNVVWSRAELQPWVERLHAADSMEVREAAITLASLGPASIEDVLLEFPERQDRQDWAPLAFQRLKTPKSMAATAWLVRTGKSGTYAHMKADEILAESGDAQWYPLLLDTALKYPKIASYMTNAAESGGERILPTLQPMLHSPDTEFTRPIAVTALGYTGSRAAVPILIDLLKSTEPGEALRALEGLRQLSHRDIGGKGPFDNPQSQYPRWAKWWDSEGAGAPIYRATDCGEVTPLR